MILAPTTHKNNLTLEGHATVIKDTTRNANSCSFSDALAQWPGTVNMSEYKFEINNTKYNLKSEVELQNMVPSMVM